MFIYTICRKGNNVDITKWTFGEALVYGAIAGIMLYILLWVCEIIYTLIWGY